MAISVPPVATVVTKWSSRASGATTDYKNGVQGAGQAWQTGVDNAEGNWSVGVSNAAGNHAYSRGVGGKASTYVDMAVNLGGNRYAGGIQAGVNKFQTGIGKVLGVISGVTLPPRGPTGTNGARSEAVDLALHQAKMNGQF